MLQELNERSQALQTVLKIKETIYRPVQAPNRSVQGVSGLQSLSLVSLSLVSVVSLSGPFLWSLWSLSQVLVVLLSLSQGSGFRAQSSGFKGHCGVSGGGSPVHSELFSNFSCSFIFIILIIQLFSHHHRNGFHDICCP